MHATTQTAERAAGIAALRLLLEKLEREVDTVPSGAEYDVRISCEIWVDGVRLYEPVTFGGLLRTARKTGRPRLEPRRNYKGI
jgi:hypothetical protein